MDDTLGPYRLLERLGAGALGEVYRGRDTRHGRTVALKIVPAAIAADPRLRRQLMTEAKQASTVSHPNVASLFEIAEDPSRLFLAFEFVPGDSLRTVMGDRPLHPRRAIDLAAQMADGLAEIHRCGLVHQDIRPANAALAQTGRVKILDLGIARWTSAGRARHAAASSAAALPRAQVQGIVAYMSPEQALGGRVDHRTDIFSLGVILYEMLTGRSPFDRTTAPESIVEIMTAAPPPPSSLNTGVPPALDTVVSKALAKSLDDRFQRATEFAAELRSVGAVLEAAADRAAHRGTGARPASQPRSRNRVAMGVALVVLSLAALALWLYRDEGVRWWRRWFSSSPESVIAFSLSPDGLTSTGHVPVASPITSRTRARSTLPPDTTITVSRAAGATFPDNTPASAVAPAPSATSFS